MWEGKRVADSFRERMLAAAKADRAQEKILSRRIAALYEKAAEDMASKAADSRSGSLTQRHAWELTQSLRERTQDLWSQVGDLTRAGMQEAALRSVGVQTTFLEDAGRMAQLDLRQSIRGSFGSVADDAVQHVLQGGVYGGKSPTLSKRIWNNAAMQSGKIEDIIAQAVAKGESPQTLAKALEAYVNPGAIEPSNWNDIYDIPFTYKVDYNAKRLAVTSLRHASWGATLRAGEKNPYADFFQWELTSAHVIYDVCDGYAVHEEGLGEGRYALNSPQLPLPHPFCTCLYYIDTDKTLDQVAEELVSWADGTRDDPKLDRAFGEWERVGMGWEDARKAGVIDPTKLITNFGVVSEDVILTNERSRHIYESHGLDYEKLMPFVPDSLLNPEHILEDWKNANTAFFVGKVDKDIYINVVVKLEPFLNTKGMNNSIITFFPMGRKTLKRLMKKATLVYTK